MISILRIGASALDANYLDLNSCSATSLHCNALVS